MNTQEKNEIKDLDKNSLILLYNISQWYQKAYIIVENCLNPKEFYTSVCRIKSEKIESLYPLLNLFKNPNGIYPTLFWTRAQAITTIRRYLYKKHNRNEEAWNKDPVIKTFMKNKAANQKTLELEILDGLEQVSDRDEKYFSHKREYGDITVNPVYILVKEGSELKIVQQPPNSDINPYNPDDLDNLSDNPYF